MKMSPPAADPDAYAAALTGWRRPLVDDLRAAVLSAAPFEEVIKWTNLVFLAEGPAVVIRAEDDRVIFGLWRGKRLLSLDPRLAAGGKYEMARIVFREGDASDVATLSRLAAEAHRLNLEFGDPSKSS